MRAVLPFALVLTMIVLHQDVWFWKSSYLVFGFIPIGLAYHICFSIMAACLFALLVWKYWPAGLEPGAADRPQDPAGGAQE